MQHYMPTGGVHLNQLSYFTRSAESAIYQPYATRSTKSDQPFNAAKQISSADSISSDFNTVPDVRWAQVEWRFVGWCLGRI